MNKELRHITLLLLAALLFIAPGCADRLQGPESPEGSDGLVTLTLTASLPELGKAATPSRGFIDMPDADYIGQLKLHVVVFNTTGVMLQYVRPADVHLVGVDEASRVATFQVRNIFSSVQPRILHVIATNIDDLTDASQVDGADNIAAMANENSSMAGLSVSGATDAYWARAEVDGINDKTVLQMRLLRNFVKLMVEYTPESSSTVDFKLKGFSVVNRPDIGTIAPFQFKDNYFAKFFDTDNLPISYDDVRASGYHGVNPGGVDNSLLNTTAAEVAADIAMRPGGPLSPEYFYERSQSGYLSGSVSDKLTYIIVHGIYRGNDNYYRIDIGADDNGRFSFFDLLRNFQYTLHITEVGGPGSPTIEEAMKAPAHNNLSTSVVTKDLFSIGYGGQRIEVSATTMFLTNSETSQLRFRYILSEKDGKTEYGQPAKLFIYDTDNELVEVDCGGAVGGKDITHILGGDVVSKAVLRGPDSRGEYVLDIDPGALPASGYMTQNLRIYYQNTDGLGRMVTLYRRRPWTVPDGGLLHDGRVYSPGMSVPDKSTRTGNDYRDNLNVFYFLPGGLGKSLFPLTLLYESDKQNIYANPEGPLVVTTLDNGSGFVGGTANNVIAYRRRIEWSEYEASSTTGMWIVSPFLYNTTSDSDVDYPTSRIDSKPNHTRLANNGTRSHAVRISNPDGVIEPVIDNVKRRMVYAATQLAWSRTGTAWPARNENPYTFKNASFTLFYRLPEGMEEEDFAGGYLNVDISSSIGMAVKDTTNGLAGSNGKYSQRISYQDYLKGREFSATFLLPAGTQNFTVTVTPEGLESVSATVLRITFGSMTVRYDRREYTEGMNAPYSSTAPKRSENAVFTVYYQLPTGIPEEAFADGKLNFVITTNQDILNENSQGDKPYQLNIESRKRATQSVTYDEYVKNGGSLWVIAPFWLSKSNGNTFTLTISNSEEVLNTDPKSIERRRN